MSKATYCPLPWNHIATTATGRMRICCNSNNLTNYIGIHIDDIKSTTELDNNHVLMETRRQMMSGIRPDTCARCFQQEDSGIESPRQARAADFDNYERDKQNTDADGKSIHQIQYIDLRLGNLCNLKCRMCNPYSSKNLIDESRLLGDITSETADRLSNLNWPSKTNVWEFLENNISNVEMIYLTGGEPTLILEQFKLLQYCIDQNYAKNITLKYNTNLTNIPQKFYEYWSHFKQVKVNCSIDGVDEVCRYIRYPSNWKTISKNFSTLVEKSKISSNIQIGVHITVQILNSTRLIDIIDYLKQYELPNNFPFLNILVVPEYYNIRALPNDIKRQIQTDLLEYDEKNFSGVVNFMMKEDHSHLLSEFKERTDKIDKIRNQKFIEVFPELRDFYLKIDK